MKSSKQAPARALLYNAGNAFPINAGNAFPVNSGKALALLAALLLSTLGCSSPPEPPAEEARTAPLLEGMGSHHFPITTGSPEAQQFFNQGLVLAYGFNHAEAVRSFREAQRLDPACAICYWGEALALGPNINSMMEAEDHPATWAALEKAQELAAGASEREQAYIRALGERYTAPESDSDRMPEDRSHLDLAYAEAMREVASAYPEDTDAGTLFAEAVMDTTPWDYWREDGELKPEAQEVLATLDTVLEQDPAHPGANHLYIHVVELGRPDAGVGAAERLATAAPGAGHLVHMPSHIYLRVGRYAEAAEANQRAIQADEDYITACRKQGLYPLAYMPHNRHFLWAAATLSGQSALALEAAREMAERQDLDAMRETGVGALQHFWITPLYALVRFGQWQEILNRIEPPEDLVYPRGVWHYARGMALTRLDRLDEAAIELERLTEIASDPVLEEVTVWDLNTTAALIAIAREALAGELELAQGNAEIGLDHLKMAVDLEDGLYYDEPPPWHAPARQYLGAALMEEGRYTEAEATYLQDLEVFPQNGWSLFGLRQSLEAQGRNEEASAVDARFQESWKLADLTLAASRF
jgi:tetratricopeptide (TPR) repeat protein